MTIDRYGMTRAQASEDARAKLIRLNRAWGELYDALLEDGDFDEAHAETCPYRCAQGDCSHVHRCAYCEELRTDLVRASERS